MKYTKLKDSAGNYIAPVTLEKLVFDSNGVRLSDKLREFEPAVIPNENLLINADFRRVVNRNGRTTYNTVGSTIDCWYIESIKDGSASFTINEGSVTWPANASFVINQYLGESVSSLIMNKTVTISCLTTDGFYSSTNEVRTVSDSGTSTLVDLSCIDFKNGWNIDIYGIPSNLRIRIFSPYSTFTTDNVNIIAVKLELGNEQTLVKVNDDGTYTLLEGIKYEEEYSKCVLYSNITGEFVGSQNSNTNMLDNWYFKDPVNRSNFTTSTAGASTILLMDRWFHGKSTVSLGTDGLLARWDGITGVDGFIQQRLRYSYVARQYTISAIIDGNLYTATLDTPTISSGGVVHSIANNGIRFSLTNISDDHIYVSITFNSTTDVLITAVKCELGPIQTLARQNSNGEWELIDPPQNYEIEYAKCIQYDKYGNYIGLDAKAVNAVSREGDTLTGNIEIEHEYEPAVVLRSIAASSEAKVVSSSDGTTQVVSSTPNDDSNKLAVTLNKDSEKLNDIIHLDYTVNGNNSTYELFGDHNPPSANEIIYNNSSSGLESTKLQGAMDEIVALVNSIKEVLVLPSQNGVLTYNGSDQSPSWLNYDSEKMVLSGALVGRDAGGYTVNVTPKDGYKWTDGTSDTKYIMWTINKATISTLPNQNGVLTYNGNEQSPSWLNYDNGKLTISGIDSGTNAGTYTVTFTPTRNYCWWDNSTSAKTVNWTINKATCECSVSNTNIILNNDNPTATVTVNTNSDGTISVISTDSSIAVATVNGNTININNVNENNGSCIINVTIGESDNYLGVSGISINVTSDFVKASKTLNDNSWATIREISDAGMAANYWEVGDTKNIVINGTVSAGSVTCNLTNLSINVFIVGIDHNSSVEGTNKIHFQIGKINNKHVALCHYYGANEARGFCMHDNGNVDDIVGWSNCYMRTTILGSNGIPSSPSANTLMAALPSDLRLVMKPITKYTDNIGDGNDVATNINSTEDYLPLLSEYEYWADYAMSNQYEKNFQKQYDYYASGNTKLRYNHTNETSLVIHWTRSPEATPGGFGNDRRFVYIDIDDIIDGLSNSDYRYMSYGISPIFAV